MTYLFLMRCCKATDIINRIFRSPVAQSVEQVAVNHLVRGSSPRWGAKQIKGLADKARPFFSLGNPPGNLYGLCSGKMI